MKNFKVVLISLLVTVTGISTFSQITIQGTVQDASDNTPLIGANISTLDGSIGTTTDFEGVFQFILPEGITTIEVSYIGYKVKRIEGLTSDAILDVKLEVGEMLEEVIVVGYTTEKKKDLTGAVSVVKMDDVDEMPSGNVIKNIQGRVAGVSITTDGSPGSGATIRIRGNSTLNNNDPLIIIDGTPTKAGMHELNPNDVESIQILKDAAAASIYGSRASNGVIVITTKIGTGEGTNVSFDANYSIQNYNTKLSPLNTYERGLVFWQASINSKLQPVSPIYKYVWNGDFNNPILADITYPEYIDANQTMKPADTRWFDEIAQLSTIQSYNLGVSKGGDNGNMSFSMGYYNHDGIIKETNFNRLNLRLNSTYKLLDGLVTIGENFQMTFQREVMIPAGDVLFTSLVQHPIVPVYTESGGWGGPVSGMTDRQNPVRLIEDNKQNSYKYTRPFGNFYINLNPLKNLNFKSSLGIDYRMYYARTVQKKYISGFLSEPNNRVNNNVNIGGNWVWSNTVTYNLTLGNNRFDFLAGTEALKFNEEFFSATREGLISEDLDYAYLNSGESNQTNSGGGTVSSLLSFFGKINFNHNEKYLASFTIRRDGSSKFGENNKFGNFPAASLGWRITEEPFIKSWLNNYLDIKLRASWGQNGNQEINPLAQYSLYRALYAKEDPIWDNPNPPIYSPALGTAYDIYGNDLGNLLSGYITTQQANPDLKWETTVQENFGIDFSAGDFTGSVDYFIKTTKDILYYQTLLSAVGEASGQFVNGGSIKNSGIETILAYQKKFGDFNIDLAVNFSTLKNQVVDMPEDLFIRLPLNNQIPNEAKIDLLGSELKGQSINSLYGYVADGLFTTQEEVDQHAEQAGKGLGRIRYKDLNNDGLIDNNDQTFIGVADPDFSYGINLNVGWKRINLSIFIQGVQGIEFYNGYKTYTDFASLWPGTNWGDRTLDAWSPENTNSSIPALTIIDTNNEGRISSYFIEDASYLKLRNIQLGYDLPESTASSLGISSARFFIQGQNIYTFKTGNFTAPDPENPNYAFPIPTIYTVGLNVKF